MRRKKEAQANELNREMRPVRCPQCGCRMMDAVNGTKTQLLTPESDHRPDFVVKCRNCGAMVGVLKTE